MRGTGRTTRMLKKALDTAFKDKQVEVNVVAYSYSHLKVLENMLKDITLGKLPKNLSIIADVGLKPREDTSHKKFFYDHYTKECVLADLKGEIENLENEMKIMLDEQAAWRKYETE